jgi:hypothetical protein
MAIMVGYCGPEANPKNPAPNQIESALVSPTIMMLKPTNENPHAHPTIVSGLNILLNGIATNRDRANEAQKTAVTNAGFEPPSP